MAEPTWGLFGSYSSVPLDPANPASAYARGVRVLVMEFGWRDIETANGTFNFTTLDANIATINQWVAWGYKVILNYGIHHAPAWWLALDGSASPRTRFKNQYGAVLTASPDDQTPNLIFAHDTEDVTFGALKLRGSYDGVNAPNGYAARYIKTVFDRLKLNLATPLATAIYAVRAGGGHYGELTYPQDFSSNAYWNYDPGAAALKAKAASLTVWGTATPWATNNVTAALAPGSGGVAGSGTVQQYQDFIDFHNSALANYQNWQLDQARKNGYTGPIMVLYPSNGALPSEVTTAVNARLPGNTVSEGGGELQRGYAHQWMIDRLADTFPVVHCTWVDNTSNKSASRLAGYADAHGYAKSGENSEGGDAKQDMLTCCALPNAADPGFAGGAASTPTGRARLYNYMSFQWIRAQELYNVGDAAEKSSFPAGAAATIDDLATYIALGQTGGSGGATTFQSKKDSAAVPTAAGGNVTVEYGSFTITPTAVAGTQQVVALANTGLTPKAVILWAQGDVAAQGATNDVLAYGMGTRRGGASQVFSVGCIDIHGNPTSPGSQSAKRISTTKLLSLPSGYNTVGPAPVIEAEASLVAFGAGSFTIQWDTPTTTTGKIIHYMVIGGSGVTDAKVGTFAATTGTAPYAQPVTGVGFRPSLMMFAHGARDGAGDSAHLRFGIGAAASATSRAASCYGTTNGVTGTTAASQYQRSDRCILTSVYNSASAAHGEADFTSFDADGFTLSWQVAAPAANPTTPPLIGYLALAGVTGAVGVDTQPTVAGSKATAGLGFQPGAAMFFHVNAAASGALVTSASALGIGASSGPGRSGATWAATQPGIALGATTPTTNAQRRVSTTQPIMAANVAGNVVQAAATLTSFDTAGFTLNWGTADATARSFWYLALPSAGTSGTTTQDLIAGFAPKAMVVFATSQAVDNAFSGDAEIAAGLTDGGNHRAVAAMAINNQAGSSVAGKDVTDGHAVVLLRNNGAAIPAVDGLATVAFTSDRATLTWAQVPTSAWLLHYLLLGGSDITGVRSGTLVASLAGGTQTVTGLPFKPDFLLLLSGSSANLGNSSHARIMLGMATAAAQGAALFAAAAGKSPASVLQWVTDQRLVVLADEANDVAAGDAHFAGFTADGFSITWDTPPVAAVNLFYLAIKGGSFYVGVDTQPATATTKQNAGVGFQPGALIFVGGNQPYNVDPELYGGPPLSSGGARMALGASDGTVEGALWAEAKGGYNPSVAFDYSTKVKLVKHAVAPTTPVGSPTTQAEAATFQMQPGGYATTWGISDGVPRALLVAAFGPAQAAGGGRGNRSLLGVG